MGRQYGLRTSMSEVGPKLGGSTPFATVISKFWLASLPDASLAVHCTGVLPTGKRLREGGVQVTWGGPHPSVATASKLTWAESPQAASSGLVHKGRDKGRWSGVACDRHLEGHRRCGVACGISRRAGDICGAHRKQAAGRRDASGCSRAVTGIRNLHHKGYLGSPLHKLSHHRCHQAE